jgi:putative MATE family efflux protein
LSNQLKLTKDPIWELLRKVTIPASIGSLFQTFYNLVDTWFAGKISAQAISAIAKSFPLYFLIIAVGVGVGASTNALIGNSIGEKKINKASLYVAQSVIFALFVSILVAFLGINTSAFFLSVMGSDAASINLSKDYLDVIFYGSAIFMVQISLNGTLNAQGDTKSYRNVLIAGFFLNIVLNPLFIFGYGFVPAFGISGLAIATVVAQSLGLFYLIYKVNSCKLRNYLKLECFIPKIQLIKDLASQAFPIVFSMLFIGIGIFVILYFIGKFGELATAGYGAALRIEQVFLLPVIALNTAVLSIGGQNFGAKKFSRIQELYFNALKFGSGFMAIAGLIIYFNAHFLVSLFTQNPVAIEHGEIYLKVAAMIGPIYPVFFISSGLFQAIKKPIYSLYMSILRLTAIPFIALWYVINIRKGDYVDIFYTILTTNWIMGMVVLVFVFSLFKKISNQK